MAITISYSHPGRYGLFSSTWGRRRGEGEVKGEVKSELKGEVKSEVK